MDINLSISEKQSEFINATEDEVLYGGAAGGGKSYGQLVDALLFALKYKGSTQLLLRRTFPELEMSLIRTSREVFPQGLCTYNESKHSYTFKNGSIVDFGYCDRKADVYRYQSYEADVIRFDELTHFEEDMYTYLISRVRGANNFPKQIKSSTNPGNVGHGWVRARFIDVAPWGETFTVDLPNGKTNTRRFIPAKVQDNSFLMESDPGYIDRLQNLPEEERKALLYGSWDVFAGQYFTEFDRAVHVCEPFTIPENWRKFRSMDWGFNDPCAIYWYAVAPEGMVYVYRELTMRETLSSNVAQEIARLSDGEDIAYTAASPDMWQKRGHTDIEGESIAETFSINGVPLLKADNNRIIGWQRVREYLKKQPDGKPNIQIFSTCLKLIETLPQMIYDDHNVEDVADGLPDHWSESLRYGLMSRPCPNREKPEKPKPMTFDPLDMGKKHRRTSIF